MDHPRMPCAKFSWNWPSGSGEEDFYFAIISPWKRAWPLICTNLNSIHLRMLSVKYGWKWSSCSGEEDENVKVYRRTMDNRQSEKLNWAFSSGELKKDKTIKKISKFILKLARMRYESISSSTHYKTIQSWDNFANNVHE